MINIFSTFLGIVIFTETAFVVALLRPLKEPYFIRDCWCKLQENYNFLSNIFSFFLTTFFINSVLEFLWEIGVYKSILRNTKNPWLVLHFYLSKSFVSLVCYIVAFYLLVLIEMITKFLIVMARLLDFELMCRYAILCRSEDPGESTTTLIIASAILK